MRLFGLIGWPLGHSFSKKYFSEKFEREGIQDARFELFPLEHIADLPVLVAQNPELHGLNVTIPHKETVIPFLHELDETARAVGAVNCIKIVENQRLIGYNTDVVGFENSLLSWFGEQDVMGLEGIILGTGGASKAVAYVLKKLGIPFKFVSRNPQNENEIRYEDLEQWWSPSQPSTLNPQPSTIIVNTTPIGTFPHTDEMPPIPPDFLKPGMFVYDLIYNPAETLLLHKAKARGCTVKNGLEMLEQQAEAAWEIWRETFDC
ncbi:MAG: shikimate dehydrogenase [Phycisphaerae bacterium]|nr:shikimate dehydrogenase [Saprospiraceae bacterium]